MVSKVNLYPEFKIGPYEVDKLLGEGSFGIVAKVKKSGYGSANRKDYALKMLKLWELMPDERKEVISRFEREFQCGEIQSEYLVRSYEKNEIEGNPYIVLEYCAGGSLSDVEQTSLDFKSINQLAADVLMGLDVLHSNGIIHRDLKPENILLDEFKKAKLTDFGIAGYMNARLTKVDLLGRAKSLFGTFAYMPPEQLNPKIAFKAMSPVTDLFSFGATFYQLITGMLPFGPLERNEDLVEYVLRANKGRWDDPSIYRKDIPQKWKDIFRMTLEPDYKKRVSSTKELLAYLGVAVHSSVDRTPILFDTDIVGLQIMHGEEPGRIYNLSKVAAGKIAYNPGMNVIPIYIGRYIGDNHNANDITIIENQSAYVSRYHATIFKDYIRKQWLICDGQQRPGYFGGAHQHSTNGTLVNSEEIGKNLVEIKNGDIITLGDTTLKVITKS
jgi:serine/threonine protein kinase